MDLGSLARGIAREPRYRNIQALRGKLYSKKHRRVFYRRFLQGNNLRI